MYHYCFLVLLLCYNVICDDCVTYTFEENENDNFTNTYGICHGMRMWNIGKFASLDIDSPHRLSTRFLQPQSALSCVSSFKFLVESFATLEVNVYMEPTTTMDQVTVLVFQSMDGGADPTVANAVLSPLDANFTPGWHTMRLTIIGTGRYEGYITFLGMASESSILLIDSFRYIAPSFDNDLCIIYKDDLPQEDPPATTTTEIGSPSTTEAYVDFTSTVATTPSSTEAIVDFTPTVATTPSSTEAIVDYTTTVATTPSSTEAIVDSTTTVANTPSSTEATVDSTLTAATTPSSTEAIVESTIPVSTTPSTTIADTTASLYPDENTTISAITTTSTTVNVTSSTTSIPSTTSEETSTTTNKTIDNTAATTDSTSAIVTTTSTTNITQSTTPSKPSSTTKVTVPATIADTTTSTTTTEKVTTTVTTKPTTTVTQPPSTSQRPSLSISLLLLKINKFFR